MKLIILLTCVLASFIIKGLQGIILNDIDVPAIVWIHDDEDIDSIKLDCNYVVEGHPNEFLVQWKKNDELIYQWIHGQKPTIIHPTENDLDIYETSKEDFQQYRGLLLLNPSIDTTGDYKCIVRSYEGENIEEKSLSKKLQVVHTRNHTLNLYHQRVENETHVECTVNDVFPKPKLDLKSDDGDPVQIISTKVYTDDIGFYNATILAVVSDDDDDPDAYICTVMFPGLPMNLTTTAESGSNILRPIIWLMFAVLLRLR